MNFLQVVSERRKESYASLLTVSEQKHCLIPTLSISLSHSNSCMVGGVRKLPHPSMVTQPVGKALTPLGPTFSSSSSCSITLLFLFICLNEVFLYLAHLL